MDISFKRFHPHDTRTALDKIKEIFSSKSRSSTNLATQPASTDASAKDASKDASKDVSKEPSKENEEKTPLDDKTEEIVSIGMHVVTGA